MPELTSHYDAIVVGSGPNGLSAAIKLAQNDLKVVVIESKTTIGGGTRTQELTEPVFYHDVCSAVHPTALSSPFFSSLPLSDYGLEWIHPDFPIAHPLDNGEAVIAHQSVSETALELGIDGDAYSALFRDLTKNWPVLRHDLFGTLRKVKHPIRMVDFGLSGMRSAKGLVDSTFRNQQAKAYFAGVAAHSILPLDKAFSASFGLVLGASVHAVGWPIAKGGSQAISSAMANYLESLNGEIITDFEVTDLSQFPVDIPVLLDLTPAQIIKISKGRLPSSIKNKLSRFKYGPGAFKMDFALSEPVPWVNDRAKRAGTLHLGGTFEEIAHSEKMVWNNQDPREPYVLVSQPSVFDASRAPNGKHTLWAYCHVPNGSEKDYSNRIIKQIERYAPGFRDIIISYSSMNAPDMESYNANYVGGDINGGAQNLAQLFGRPLLKWDPYHLKNRSYICSSSTPPGGGVHGMCGFHAARSLLRREFNIH